MNSTDYIRALVLAEPDDSGLAVTRTRSQTRDAATGEIPALPASPLPSGLQAAVDAGSLLSFVDGITTQERDDVLHSVQLAHRGASGRFDRGTQVVEQSRRVHDLAGAGRVRRPAKPAERLYDPVLGHATRRTRACAPAQAYRGRWPTRTPVQCAGLTERVRPCRAGQIR